MGIPNCRSAQADFLSFPGCRELDAGSGAVRLRDRLGRRSAKLRRQRFLCLVELGECPNRRRPLEQAAARRWRSARSGCCDGNPGRVPKPSRALAPVGEAHLRLRDRGTSINGRATRVHDGLGRRLASEPRRRGSERLLTPPRIHSCRPPGAPRSLWFPGCCKTGCGGGDPEGFRYFEARACKVRMAPKKVTQTRSFCIECRQCAR